MRHSLLSAFSSIHTLDLHGSTKRQEKGPHGSRDENVFDILPGVAISMFVRRAASREWIVKSNDVWGTREAKIEWLTQQSLACTNWNEVKAKPTYYLLTKRDLSAEDAYGSALPLTEIMPYFATGIQTSRDDFAVSIDRSSLVNRMKRFFDVRVPDETIFSEMRIADLSFWKPSKVRRSKILDDVLACIRPVEFRTFDKRWVVLHDAIVHRPRGEVMSCLDSKRKGLLVSRQQSTAGFRHAFVVDAAADMFCISNKSREGQSVFPLYVREHDGLNRAAHWATNLRDGISKQLHLPEDNPELILNLMYAQWHSPEYRLRFAEHLKMEFPRVFVPKTSALSRSLSELGGELISLHLLASPRLDTPISSITGFAMDEVEKVIYANATVWLDKKQTRGFTGVSEAVWNFHIGGYQVCEKWLKDRKGRKLSKDDIAHYQKIVVALSETIRLMKEIDETIEKHGGWPGAFVTGVKEKTA
jgi:predicted helicase